MEKKAIFVLGAPNSGKGTQAKLLAEKLGFFHFITSQVGREYIASHNDEETLKQKEKYSKGVLFDPPWLVNKVMKEKTAEIFNNAQGIVYDGSPRTLYEAENLFDILGDAVKKENIFVIEIDVSEEELKDRVKKRLICLGNASHVFIRSENLKAGDKCPESGCDGILGVRDLDKEGLFEIRMAEYINRTMPGLDHLKKLGLVKVVNGEQSVEGVQKDILKALGNFE